MWLCARNLYASETRPKWLVTASTNIGWTDGGLWMIMCQRKSCGWSCVTCMLTSTLQCFILDPLNIDCVPDVNTELESSKWRTQLILLKNKTVFDIIDGTIWFIKAPLNIWSLNYSSFSAMPPKPPQLKATSNARSERALSTIRPINWCTVHECILARQSILCIFLFKSIVLYVWVKIYVCMFESIVFFDSKLLRILYLSLINWCSQLEWVHAICMRSDMSCISKQTLKHWSSNWVYKKIQAKCYKKVSFSLV